MPDRKRKKQRKNRELDKRNKEHKKEWGVFVIKEQIGAGETEKMGLHIEKLKFTRKEGEMKNIIL